MRETADSYPKIVRERERERERFSKRAREGERERELAKKGSKTEKQLPSSIKGQRERGREGGKETERLVFTAPEAVENFAYACAYTCRE